MSTGPQLHYVIGGCADGKAVVSDLKIIALTGLKLPPIKEQWEAGSQKLKVRHTTYREEVLYTNGVVLYLYVDKDLSVEEALTWVFNKHCGLSQ